MDANHSVLRTFNEHSREVYSWAYRLLGRHHDALDVAQDVFVRWMQQCALQPPRQPRAWLRQVTMHRSIDFCRSKSAQRIRGSPLGEVEQVDKQEVRPGDEQTALRNELSAALGRLSELQRNVLVSKVYDEMTFAQIAQEQGISVSTAKTHYLRAIRAARDHLNARWGNEVGP